MCRMPQLPISMMDTSPTAVASMLDGWDGAGDTLNGVETSESYEDLHNSN